MVYFLIFQVVFIVRTCYSMSMSTHISKACSSAFFRLHNIRRIKKYLSVDSLRTIVHTFITFSTGLL